MRVLDRTFNYNTHRAKELLELFLEYHPDIRFHLEIHPALLSEELKEELKHLPKGLLHLEAGIQSLREPVLEKSRRMGKLTDALEGLKFLCSLPNMETHADLIAGLPLYHLSEIFEDIRVLAAYGAAESGNLDNNAEETKMMSADELEEKAVTGCVVIDNITLAEQDTTSPTAAPEATTQPTEISYVADFETADTKFASGKTWGGFKNKSNDYQDYIKAKWFGFYRMSDNCCKSCCCQINNSCTR